MSDKTNLLDVSVGIDFGTSNSSVAFARPGRQVEVVHIDGRLTTPSVVMMRKEGTIVGILAKNRSGHHAHETVRSIKRVVGNEEWRWSVREKTFTPTDIVRLIFDHLKTSAEWYLRKCHGGVRMGNVVMTLPAAFTDTQRKVLLEAGRQAGLDVQCFLSCGMAAALAWRGLHDARPILFFGLGGGFFAATIVRITNSVKTTSFEFLADEGLSDLGGDDFDRAILELTAFELKEQCGIDILDDENSGCEIRALAEARQNLLAAAERSKQELSELGVKSASLAVPHAITDKAGRSYILDSELKLDQFNERISPMLLRSIAVVEKALERAKLRADEISRIVLVGGSTCVPLVRQLLRDRFDQEPYCDTSLGSAGCQGAAIFALSLAGRNQGSVAPQVPKRIELPVNLLAPAACR